MLFPHSEEVGISRLLVGHQVSAELVELYRNPGQRLAGGVLARGLDLERSRQDLLRGPVNLGCQIRFHFRQERGFETLHAVVSGFPALDDLVPVVAVHPGSRLRILDYLVDREHLLAELEELHHLVD